MAKLLNQRSARKLWPDDVQLGQFVSFKEKDEARELVHA